MNNARTNSSQEMYSLLRVVLSAAVHICLGTFLVLASRTHYSGLGRLTGRTGGI